LNNSLVLNRGKLIKNKRLDSSIHLESIKDDEVVHYKNEIAENQANERLQEKVQIALQVRTLESSKGVYYWVC